MTNDPSGDPTSDPARDPERDAWLSQALRHAPDAQAAPPAALSEAILRQARAATAAARAPQPLPARRRWRAAWEALARPSVAAGFASVLVATVVGMLWWDRPMDSTIARAPAADASPPAAPPVPPPADAPIVAAAPEPDAAAKSVAPERADAAAMQKGAARPPAPRRDALAAAKDGASVAAPPPAAAPAAEPGSPSPAPFASRAREPDAEALADRRAETLRNESRALGGTAAPAPSIAARPAASLRSDLLPDPRPATPSALLASIGAQPERWAWERGGPLQPMTPALRRWLVQFAAAIAAAPMPASADAGSVGEAAVLRLYRDGALSATLRLDDVSVGLVPGPRTALSPTALSALKQGLADATR